MMKKTRLKTAAAIASLLPAPLFAQSDGPSGETLTDAEAVLEADAIVVTGTTIRGIAPPATPVLTFDSEDILLSGAPSLAEFLRLLPQNTGGNAASDEGRALGANFGGSAVSFRGFGPQRTLTLLNGARVAPQGDGVFVDVSFIPAAALESIEIVPVGASSIYGADAVGGVVNFRLRDDYKGLETRAQAGTATEGGGTTWNVTQSAGTTWRGGGGFLAYDFFDQEGILAGERDFTGTDVADTSLTPDIERHSVLASLRQNLGASTEVLLDGYFVSTQTVRQSQFPFVAGALGFNLPLEENIETGALGGTLTVRRQIGRTWLAQLITTYSENDLDGFDIDPRTGERTNIFGNAEFERFNRTVLVEPRIDGDLFSLPGGAVKLALGGQARFERFDRFLGGDDPVSTNTRTIYSAYGELFLPLVGAGNRRPGLERLEFSASGRYEHFGDVSETLSTGEEIARGGDTDSFDPQFGLVYAPAERLDLRASYGTSFTVAPLTTLRRDNRLFALQFLQLDQPLDGAPNTLLVSGVDPDLGPETSTYWTVGADWRPAFAEGLRLSVTYYDIDLEDVLGNPGGSTDPANPLIADFVTLNPTAQQIETVIDAVDLTAGDIFSFGPGAPAFSERGFASIGAIYQSSTTNLARQLYRGLDFTMDYEQFTDWGRFGGTANIVYVTDYEEQASDAQPAVDRLDTPFQPLDLRARIGGFAAYGAAFGNIFVNYAGGYEDNRFDEIRDVDAFVTIDVNVAYDLGGGLRGVGGDIFEGARLQLNVQNLLNQEPPELRGLSSENDAFTDDLGYDFVNATARGRFVSIAITKSW